MRPKNLRTKIFLDGGDPAETKQMMAQVGFVDGQTTNPSLVAKNPQARARLKRSEKFSRKELLSFYKKIVQEIALLTRKGSVSVEVYANENSSADKLFQQGKEMFSWIPNAHIKYPVTPAGLEAAERSISEGIRVNLTLVFSQAQAAAVHSATRGAKRGEVFVSPFVGRLNDRGKNGIQLVENILKMYRKKGSHVEVLTASVRSLEHFLKALSLGSDIVTAPWKIIKQWKEAGMPVPKKNYPYEAEGLAPIPYQKFNLNADWRSFAIHHPLTSAGQEKFAQDWDALLKT